MNKILICTFLLASAISAASQNLTWSARLQVNNQGDEKKLPLFLKSNYSKFKFLVYETVTGEHTGAVVIESESLQFSDLEMLADFQQRLATFKSEKGLALAEVLQVQHLTRVEGISVPNPDRRFHFLEVTLTEYLPGRWPYIRDLLDVGKEARSVLNSKQDLAFFRVSSGGLINSYLTIRYLDKLEELGVGEDWGAAYEKAHVKDSFVRRNTEYYGNVTKITIETRRLRSDLSVVD